jgi:hypothetical protein
MLLLLTLAPQQQEGKSRKTPSNSAGTPSTPQSTAPVANGNTAEPGPAQSALHASYQSTTTTPSQQPVAAQPQSQQPQQQQQPSHISHHPGSGIPLAPSNGATPAHSNGGAVPASTPAVQSAAGDNTLSTPVPSPLPEEPISMGIVGFVKPSGIPRGPSVGA